MVQVRTSNHFDSLKKQIVLFRWNLREPVQAKHPHPVLQAIISLKRGWSVDHRRLSRLHTMMFRDRSELCNAWKVPGMQQLAAEKFLTGSFNRLCEKSHVALTAEFNSHPTIQPQCPVDAAYDLRWFCRRRSENVALGGEWPSDEKRSARMITLRKSTRGSTSGLFVELLTRKNWQHWLQPRKLASRFET